MSEGVNPGDNEQQQEERTSAPLAQGNVQPRKRLKSVQKIGVGIGALLALVVVALAISFLSIGGLPFPFGNNHQYSEQQLAQIIQGINIPNKVISRDYQGNCGFTNSETQVAEYFCSSNYEVVFRGNADTCTNYSAVYAAMEKAGYSYDHNTQDDIASSARAPISAIPNFVGDSSKPGYRDCQIQLNSQLNDGLNGQPSKLPGATAGYSSSAFVSKTHGNGAISCTMPPQFWPEVDNEQGWTADQSINYRESNKANFSCVIQVYSST